MLRISFLYQWVFLNSLLCFKSNENYSGRIWYFQQKLGQEKNKKLRHSYSFEDYLRRGRVVGFQMIENLP